MTTISPVPADNLLSATQISKLLEQDATASRVLEKGLVPRAGDLVVYHTEHSAPRRRSDAPSQTTFKSTEPVSTSRRRAAH